MSSISDTGITGGYVLYGRTVNTGDYNSKKAEVRFDFLGEDYTDAAAEKAVAKCNEILGMAGRPPRKSADVASPSEAPTESSIVTADPAAIGEEDLFQASAPEITDVDLTSAITKKNGELKDAKKIRGLVAEFVPAPKTSREIPQADRARFLEKLATLS